MCGLRYQATVDVRCALLSTYEPFISDYSYDLEQKKALNRIGVSLDILYSFCTAALVP